MASLSYHLHSQGKKLVELYISDWVAILVLLICLLCFELMAPFHRLFYIDDMRISYPMAEHEQIPNWLCLLISPVLTGVVIVAVPILYSQSRHKIQLIHMSLLGLVLSFAVNGVITDLLKLWIGNPRPDFLARCIPAEGTPKGTLVGIEVCTNPNIAVVQEGFKSTPSGHSSNSFSSLFYLSFWLAGQFSAFRPGAPLFKGIIAFIPTVLALFVAASRTADYRHHFSDVVSGTFLGCLIGWLSYRKYFPGLSTSKSFEPHIVQKNEQLHQLSSQNFYYDSENSSEDAGSIV